MLLYDVTYPHSRDLDSRVGWEYLRRLAAHGKKHEGARAVCVNGGEGPYVLCDGEWRADRDATTDARA
jgi:hypothetical protein